MAFYLVTLRQRYLEQQAINQFTYAADEGLTFTPNALDLLTLMGFMPQPEELTFPVGSIAEALQELQNASTLYLEVECRNLYSDTDFYLAAYNPVLAGVAAGVATTPVLAYGFLSDRVTLAVRRGFKRFVGVTEEAMSAGGNLTGTVESLAVLLADRMSEVLEGGSTSNYRPCVLSYEKYVTPSGRDAYKPYGTQAEQEAHAAIGVSWQPYLRVRTQNSRQYGRGS